MRPDPEAFALRFDGVLYGPLASRAKAWALLDELMLRVDQHATFEASVVPIYKPTLEVVDQ